MANLFFAVPLVVLLFEYLALKSSVVFAESVLEYQPPVVNLLGGIIKLGENIPYDAIPNLVITLHLLALFFSVVFFAYFALFYDVPEKAVSVDYPQGN